MLLQILLVFENFSAFRDTNEACVVSLLNMLDIVFVLNWLVAFCTYEFQSAEDIQKCFRQLNMSKIGSAVRTSFTLIQPVLYTAGANNFLTV